MQAAWRLGGSRSAREIYEAVVQAHDVVLVTVVTVLNKLVEKGWMTRARQHDLLHYEPRVTEAEFTALASRHLVEGVLSLSPDVVAASFVDVLAERDPGQLAELGRLIRRRLREQDQG